MESLTAFVSLLEESTNSSPGSLPQSQANAVDASASYISFIKAKFKNKEIRANDEEFSQWLADFTSSNKPSSQSNSSVSRTDEKEDMEMSADEEEPDLEEIPLSQSQFTWRFGDDILATKDVKMDNYFEESESRRLTTGDHDSDGDGDESLSAYLPSGMAMANPDSNADESEVDYLNLEVNSSLDLGRKKIIEHVVVDELTDLNDVETLSFSDDEDVDQDENAPNDRHDQFPQYDDIIQLLNARGGSRYSTAIEELRHQQILHRYGLSSKEISFDATSMLEPDLVSAFDVVDADN